MSLATSLLEALSVVPDPRLERRKEHRWGELLFIAIYTLLTGGESFYDLEEFASPREASRARTGFTVANLGVARRPALNLLRRDKTPNRSIKRKQGRAALNPDTLPAC